MNATALRMNVVRPWCGTPENSARDETDGLASK
jgi:hypothetical protein